MQQLLNLFRALGDETRLRTMLLVQYRELSIGELAAVFDQSQPRVSRHVRILDEAGLIERRKEGSWVFIRPARTDFDHVLSSLLQGRHGAGAETARQDREALDRLREAGAREAEKWFEANAFEWDCLRSLHVPESNVEQAILSTLDDREYDRMADIGTGTGRMVELLGDRAAHVVALDRSPSMLRLARAKLDGREVDFLQGDFNDLPLEENSCDLMVFHQVLHFAQHPERVMAEAARVLKPGGDLLIADFALHQREELRTRFAHNRLGFADDDMEQWMADCGLAPVERRELAGGPLTVKIWKGRLGADRIEPVRQEDGISA